MTDRLSLPKRDMLCCARPQGGKGNLTVRLERPVKPTAITIEHLHAAFGATDGGKKSSAPKSFHVWGYGE